MAGPATNKNGKCLLHGKFNAINPWLCLHTGYCKWVLVRPCFLLQEHSPLRAGSCAPRLPLFCVKAPSAGPAWHGNSATSAAQTASSPKMDQSAKQSSISWLFSREPFPWLRQWESQERFSKTQLGWTHTLPVPHVRWTEGHFFKAWRIARFQAFPWCTVNEIFCLLEGNAIPQELFCTANPFIFMERIVLNWARSRKVEEWNQSASVSWAGYIDSLKSLSIREVLSNSKDYYFLNMMLKSYLLCSERATKKWMCCASASLF